MAGGGFKGASPSPSPRAWGLGLGSRAGPSHTSDIQFDVCFLCQFGGLERDDGVIVDISV